MHYSSKITLPEKDLLRVELNYEIVTTREEAEMLKDIFQIRLSRKVGRPIPRDEIQITPDEGQVRRENIQFIVRKNESFYVGLNYLHQKAPYVLPRLVEELQHYLESMDVVNHRRELLDFTISGLNGIIERRLE